MQQMRIDVRPITATLTKKDIFSAHIDPYCVVMCNTQAFRTSPARTHGTYNWVESFNVGAAPNDLLRVELRAQNYITRDRLVGEVVIPLFEVFRAGQHSGWFTLTRQGKAKGKIMLDLRVTNAFMPVAAFAPVYQPNHGVMPVYVPPMIHRSHSPMPRQSLYNSVQMRPLTPNVTVTASRVYNIGPWGAY